MKPDYEQIQSELDWMNHNRPKIPARLRDKFEAALFVLKKKPTRDDIYARFTPDETAEEYEESDQDILLSALDVRSWLDGDNDAMPPSKDWGPVIHHTTKY